MISRPAVCLVFSVVVCLFPCAAQDGGSVTVRFLSFPKALDPKPVELVVGEHKTIKVEIPSNELSPPYKVPQAGAWVLGETTAGSDGKQTFHEWGRAKALASPAQLVLLVRKGKENADGFEVIPVDNRTASFGGGKFLFMNAARVDIAGNIGEQKFVLKPGRHAIIEPKARPGAHTFQTELWFRKDDAARPFFSSQWPVSDKARALVFFYHDPAGERLRLHTIREFVRDGAAAGPG